MLEATVQQMLLSRAGSIEAPAGTGKTEQIANVGSSVPGRWLILTHTVAGVDAIRGRLAKRQVPAEKAQVETLSAWAHRWARAFPIGSGLATDWTAASRDWDAVIRAATRLIESGAVQSVLSASYDGVLVDEYQDCTVAHHALVSALARRMRCFVFGDPLQAIFGFRPGILANWHSDTLATFPESGRLNIPQRWIHAGNADLGYWLINQRANFFAGTFDFRHAPPSLSWHPCPYKLPARYLAQACSVRNRQQASLAVIHSSVDELSRADLAKAMGAATVEPIGGRSEREFYARLRTYTGLERVRTVLDLAATAYAGVDAASKRRRVESLLTNPDRVRNPPTPSELALCGVATSVSFGSVLDALQTIGKEVGVSAARPELISCINLALRLCIEDPSKSLDDAAFSAAHAQRQKGRARRNRSVGSTLLLKGLEFDHVVITPEACGDRNHWYVALTRGTKSVRILSPTVHFSA